MGCKVKGKASAHTTNKLCVEKKKRKRKRKRKEIKENVCCVIRSKAN